MEQQNGSVLCVKALVSLLLFAPTQIAVHAQIPGTITSVAGTEGCGNLTADPTGDLYILDSYGVQKMAAGTSRITTVASGDLTISGGGMAIDTTGNLYIAQGSYGPLANTVQRIAAETRAITTVAGTKEKYDGLSRRIPGPATQAFLLSPQVLGLDSGGNLYIGEGGSGHHERCTQNHGIHGRHHQAEPERVSRETWRSRRPNRRERQARVTASPRLRLQRGPVYRGLR